MNKRARYALIKLIASIASWFSAAWALMLVSGALLGDEGLWTPAYWQCFWGLYAVVLITTFIVRNAYATVQALIQQELARPVEPRKKPLI